MRRALDRTPGIDSCIQTVVSRGYRFVATVTRASQPTAVAPWPDVREPPSIAVLPFPDANGDVAQDYFADGMTADITSAIGRFPWLFVVPRCLHRL